MYSDLTLGAVTLVGQKHVHRGIPCEDASFAVSADGVSVVCIADGAGSKQYTHARYGSQACVKTISDLLIKHFDAIYNENREAASRSLIIASIHVRFAELMREHKLRSIEQLSCTLLFVAVKDRRMLIGHIGDGLTVKVTSSGVSPITMPQNGTNASSTYFVTANHAADYLRLVKTTTDDCHAVVLMTDGVQDAVYDESKGLVKPVVARMADTLSNGREKGEAELKDIIGKFVVGASNNSDDASFGAIYFNGTAKPDYNSLPTDESPFPRSEDSFRDLQEKMVPLVKKARDIIVEQQVNSPVGEKPNEDIRKKSNPEPETQAKETPKKITNVKTAGMRKSKLMIGIMVAEFLLILVLLIILFFALGGK